MKLDQVTPMNDARRWQFSAGCAILFLVLCAVPIGERLMLAPIIAVQNAVLNSNTNRKDTQKQYIRHEEFIEDKERVASQLLGGERVTWDQAEAWRAPYISSDPTASPLSQRIANWQNGTHTSELTPAKPANSPMSQDEYNAIAQRITSNKQKVQDLQTRAIPGKVSTQELDDLYRRINSLNQQIETDYMDLRTRSVQR